LVEFSREFKNNVYPQVQEPPWRQHTEAAFIVERALNKAEKSSKIISQIPLLFKIICLLLQVESTSKCKLFANL